MANNWISVKDRLPNGTEGTGKIVLAWTNDAFDPWQIAVYWGANKFPFSKRYYFGVPTATHWMNLPEGPTRN